MRLKYRLTSCVNFISNLIGILTLNKSNIFTISILYMLLQTKLKTQMILRIIKRLGLSQLPLTYYPRLQFSQTSINTIAQQKMKLSPTAYSTAIIFKKLRSATSVEEAVNFLQENNQQIHLHGKTIIFQHFNQLFIDPRGNYSKNVIKMNDLLSRINKLNLYQSILKLSILQKSRTFFVQTKNQQKFQSLSAIYVEEILKSMENQVSTFIDCFNIFAIFRLQYYPKLSLKTLETLDRMLKDNKNKQKSEIYSQSYEKFWSIIFNQISYLEWLSLKKFPALIDFIVNEFSVKDLYRRDMQLICKAFMTFSEKRFHLVGAKKIPKCIKQAINILEANLAKLSDDQILRLIDSTSYLPAQLILPFKKKLVNKIFLRENAMECIRSKFFPALGVSLQDINLLFDKYDTIDWLWNNLVYYSSEKLQRKLIRGRVKEHFRKLIIQNSKKENQKLGLFDINQTVSRLIMLAYNFSIDKEFQIVELIQEMITKQFKKKGIKQVVESLSNDNFFILFSLYEKKPQIFKQLVEEFKAVMAKRKKNKFFANLRFRKKYLPAIQIFIDSEIPVIKNWIKQYYKDLISTFASFDTPQSEDEFIYLIQLMNCKNDTSFAEEKKALLNKIKGDVCQTLCQYYILYERKSFKAFKQILSILVKNTNSVLKVIKFVCSLPLQSIQNTKGRIQQSLLDFLTESKQSLNFGIKHLNQIHTFLDISLHHQNMRQFSFRLYEQNLTQLEKDLEQRDWMLMGNGRMIFEFLMKFEQLIPSNEIGKWLVILERVKRLSQKIIDNQKSDFSPYYQTKYLQFLIIYRDYLNLEAGYEIEILFNLQRVLGSTQSLVSFQQILFTLLKLYSLNIEEAQLSNIVQFSAVIRKGIKEGTFSIFKCKDLIISAIYHIKVLNKSSQINRFRQIISPLVLQSIRSYRLYPDIHIMKPFIKYFLLTKQINKIEDILTNILSSYSTPSTIVFFIKNLPIMSISEQLFKLILNKIDKMVGLVDNNSIQFLFFLQKIWFEAPKQYQSVYLKLWARCQQYLSSKIKILNEKGQSGKDAEYILGLYPLYLFCCIKAGKVQGNKVFDYLSQHILNNKVQFLKKIKNNQLLHSINSCVVLYIEKLHNKKSTREQKQTIFKKSVKTFSITSNFQYSKLLEQYLNANKMQYMKKCPKNDILLPYFIPSKNQIVLVANLTDENSIYKKEDPDQIKQYDKNSEASYSEQLTLIEKLKLTNQEKIKKISLNGYFRFQVEMYRFLHKDMKIVIWHDSVGEIFLD